MKNRNILNIFRMNISKSTPRPYDNSNVTKNRGINNDNNDRIKIERPNKYYGQRDKFENWFMQMELFFGFQKKNPHSQPQKSYIRNHLHTRQNFEMG